ncbi:a-factor receptor [Ceratobasidium sp. 428]|nr:a-factor receptor [Ceratobasidium sp. 428]
MRDLAFPVLCALGLVLCAVPLPWHWEARNTGTLLYLGWTITGCLVFMTNSIVWAGNTEDVAPVWCDISSRIIIGLSVGLPATSLCVQRRLHRVATYDKASGFPDSWKREMLIDILIAIGLPAIVMVLYHVIQNSRYIIVEDIGCYPSIHSSLVKVPMVMMWPIIIAFVSFVYAGSTIRAFFKMRRQFSKILSDSNDNLSMSRYFRLMALAGTDIAFSLPLSLYALVHGLQAEPPRPWVSWSDTHQYIHEVWTINREMILAVPGYQSALDVNRWAVPGCAFLFFAFFGLSSEAMKQYKRFFWTAVAPFGIKPSVPNPRRLTASWTRRPAARATRSNHDLTTFPSAACFSALDVVELNIDTATHLDVTPDTPFQDTGIKIGDLESQK